MLAGSILITDQLTTALEFVRFGSFSNGHDHEACWSNPMQMIGQVECKWVGKSMQLPVFRRERRDVL
jgi:hypothetical protein